MKERPCKSLRDLVSATTIADIKDAIEAEKELADHQGV
jgi:hypothetical protein